MNTFGNNVKEYTVYLTATSNQILTEQIDNGKIIKGTLCVNLDLHEISFTFKDRIALHYNEFSADADEISFSDGFSYYSFSTKQPEIIRTVN